MNFPMHKHGGDVDGIGGGGGGSFRAAKFKRNLATKVCRWFACLIEIDIYLDSYSGRTHWALRWLMFNLSINMCLILSWSTSTQWPNGRPMVWVKMSQQHGQCGGHPSIYLSKLTIHPSIYPSIELTPSFFFSLKMLVGTQQHIVIIVDMTVFWLRERGIVFVRDNT